jgi:hypothetical protein
MQLAVCWNTNFVLFFLCFFGFFTMKETNTTDKDDSKDIRRTTWLIRHGLHRPCSETQYQTLHARKEMKG